jgi:hypothetical protein
MRFSSHGGYAGVSYRGRPYAGVHYLGRARAGRGTSGGSSSAAGVRAEGTCKRCGLLWEFQYVPGRSVRCPGCAVLAPAPDVLPADAPEWRTRKVSAAWLLLLIPLAIMLWNATTGSGKESPAPGDTQGGGLSNIPACAPSNLDASCPGSPYANLR